MVLATRWFFIRMFQGHGKRLKIAALILGIVSSVLCAFDLFGDAHSSWSLSHGHMQLSEEIHRSDKGTATRTFPGDLRFRHGVEVGSPVEGVKHPKWAVCTTKGTPTQAILDFVKQEVDWAIVIVGEEDSPHFPVTGKNTFYLGAAEQRALGQEHKEIFRLLPSKHSGRKNVGYLYAIMHGAALIWDFEDDNYLKGGVFPDVPAAATIKEVVFDDDCPAFNPLPLVLGAAEATAMWPRGYPLTLIKSSCEHKVTVGDVSRIGVFQSLADSVPDIDSVCWLTHDTPIKKGEQTDESTYALPKGTLSPYNAMSTLVTKPAFWSLLLPISVHSSVSDIWRSYIAQRLLWDAGLQIAFTPPLVDRNPLHHDYVVGIEEERPFISKSLKLLKYLHAWKGQSPALAGRFEELMVGLYENGFIDLNDVYLAQEWIAVLGRVGYELPPVSGEGVVPAMPPQSHRSCPTTTRVLVTGKSTSD